MKFDSNMTIAQLFSKSAMHRVSPVNPVDTMDWFQSRKEAHRFDIHQIPFKKMVDWRQDAETGNIVHSSGRFFSIRGIDINTNWGGAKEWQQPIIDQPEIGYLGFIVRMMDGVLHFLVQAKMEPGNINYIQLAPTLQATRSNFLQVHKGKKPPYLEYFQHHAEHAVLLDVLQSEQGARFLRKRNRNIILQVDEEIPVLPDYCWMPLGQLLEALQHDNLVNMDARTVLSCIPFDVKTLLDEEKNGSRALLCSLDNTAASWRSVSQILSWFTEQKFHYWMDVIPLPMKNVEKWVQTEYQIHHVTHKYFSVIACSVTADNREVATWTQPMVKAAQKGLIAFIVKEIKGVLHFLVQAKVEPGNFDVVEMAPTVQCITGSYEETPREKWPPYLEYVLSAKTSQLLCDTCQSEEGGRFYQEENRNVIVWADDSFSEQVSDRFIWMTAGQLKHFIQYNNFINVQARCLLASLNPAKRLFP
ncbi:MAG: NDP-hexose 2,3-dehydratase [Spartobacteria bacterium]|nr:NDP-hexose 2,3-dehydratase [Spartobacteria bacterium]